MKTLIGIVVVLAVVYFVAAPYLTAYQIQTAADRGDAAGVAEHVDFESVRASLRPQVQDRVATGAAQAAGDDRLAAALGAAAGGALADRALEAYVTPEGLARVISGGEPDPDSPLTQRMDNVEASAGYRSFDEFAVVLTDPETGDDVELLFHRRGLGWKVTEVALP